MNRQHQIEVSIIVPAYNEEETISDCISSLLSQDYPEDKYEIIIINDGSTDSTGSILEEFAARDSRVIVIFKEQGGKGSAQNIGLRHAHGKLILITDADAIVPPDWVSSMTSHLVNTDMVIGGCFLGTTPTASLLDKIQNSAYVISFKYRGFRGTPRSGIDIGFRKTIADSLGGFDEGIIAVTPDFVQRAQAHGYTVQFCPDIAVLTRGVPTLLEFIKQKLRWREYPLDILKGRTRPGRADIIGIGYTHGLSLVLLALTIVAIALLDFRYFLAPFILILLVDITLYIKPIYRMWQDKADRKFMAYFILYSILIMLVRLILIPYLVYRLAAGIKPTFEARRT